MNSTARLGTEAEITGHSSSDKTPTPLTRPACSRALTGDGASAVSGNHRCMGTKALRAIPATTTKSAMAVTHSPGAVATAPASDATSRVPSASPDATTAIHKAASPISSRAIINREDVRDCIVSE